MFSYAFSQSAHTYVTIVPIELFYAAFKSSSDVRAYELTSRYYDVGCVQVTLVGTRWRINFST